MTGRHDPRNHSRPTTSEDFKHWFDHPYYWIKRRLPIIGVRYLIGLLCAALVYTVGLLIGLLAGRVADFALNRSVILVCLYIVYSLSCYRFVTERYHAHTARIGSCFELPAEKFNAVAQRLARRAADVRPVVIISALVTALVWSYYAAITFRVPGLPRILYDLYPPDVPLDHKISTLLATWLMSGALVVLTVTSVRLSFALINFLRALKIKDVTPWPSLVSDSFAGLQRLTLWGVALFAVGDALVALLYLGPNPHTSPLTNGVSFPLFGARISVGLVAALLVLAAVVEGIFVYVLPYRIIHDVLAGAREKLHDRLVQEYSDQRLHADTGLVPGFAALSELYRTEIVEREHAITAASVAGFVAVQLVPLLPLILQNAVGLPGHR
jgi:hypothetical protein